MPELVRWLKPWNSLIQPLFCKPVVSKIYFACLFSIFRVSHIMWGRCGWRSWLHDSKISGMWDYLFVRLAWAWPDHSHTVARWYGTRTGDTLDENFCFNNFCLIFFKYVWFSWASQWAKLVVQQSTDTSTTKSLGVLKPASKSAWKWRSFDCGSTKTDTICFRWKVSKMCALKRPNLHAKNYI